MAANEDLRVIKTHKALCQAFLELMNKKNFENITVSELCDKAMVRRATFYKHFSDKYDFFRFFILQLQKKLENECIDEIKDAEPYDYFTISAKKLIYFLDENEKMVQHLWESNLMLTLLDTIGEQMFKNFSQNHITPLNIPQTELAFMVSFYTGGLMQTIRWWLSNKTLITKDQLIDLCKNRIDIIKQATVVTQTNKS
mgnify:CR=1 FL=1